MDNSNIYRVIYTHNSNSNIFFFFLLYRFFFGFFFFGEVWTCSQYLLLYDPTLTQTAHLSLNSGASLCLHPTTLLHSSNLISTNSQYVTSVLRETLISQISNCMLKKRSKCVEKLKIVLKGCWCSYLKISEVPNIKMIHDCLTSNYSGLNQNEEQGSNTTLLSRIGGSLLFGGIKVMLMILMKKYQLEYNYFSHDRNM